MRLGGYSLMRLDDSGAGLLWIRLQGIHRIAFPFDGPRQNIESQTTVIPSDVHGVPEASGSTTIPTL